jgi:hypothetical protein
MTFVWAALYGAWGAVIVARIWIRIARRLPVFQPQFPGLEAIQNWGSARSSEGILGGSWMKNTVWSALTPDALHVGVHFPFNLLLLILPARVKLDLRIPVASISSIERRSTFFRTYVRINYQLPGASSSSRQTYLDLMLRGPDLRDKLEQKVRAAPGQG